MKYFTSSSYILFAVVVALLIVFGLFSQCIALAVFSRKSFKIQPINPLFINLVCANIVMIVVCYPLVLIACIYQGKWTASLWVEIFCPLSAFITAVSNIAAIVSLVCITQQLAKLATSVTNGKSLRKLNPVYIVTSWIYAFVCMLPTIAGWSRLEFEPGYINCAPKWTSNQPADVSYLIVLISLAFVFPLTLQIISFVRIRKYLTHNAGTTSATISRNKTAARYVFCFH